MDGHEEAFTALCRILDERRALYERADWTVDTTDRTVAAIATELADSLGAEFGSER